MLVRVAIAARLVVSCALCFALSACAHAPPSAPKPPNPLQDVATVTLDPYINPGRPFFESASDRWAMAADLALTPPGLRPSEAARYSQGSPPTFRSMLEAHQIDVNAILAAQIRSALAAQTRFRVVDSDADASLQITMQSYGLGVRTGFSDKMSAWLRFEVTLTDRNGRLLYKEDFNERNTEATRYTPDEFVADPERIRAAFTDAAAVVAGMLKDSVIDFSQDPEARVPESPKNAVILKSAGK